MGTIEHQILDLLEERGRHVRGWGGGCAGGGEGMWAVGAVGEVGTLLWVVNAVKAQNHTKQEGAPPSADPGGVGGLRQSRNSYMNVFCWSRLCGLRGRDSRASSGRHGGPAHTACAGSSTSCRSTGSAPGRIHKPSSTPSRDAGSAPGRSASDGSPSRVHAFGSDGANGHRSL